MTTAAPERTTIRALAGFLPKQDAALDALYSHKYILYGGAAGPGKSYWLRWAALHFLIECATKGVHDVRVGLFCEDYPTLADRQISRIKREFPSWLGTLKGSREEGFGFFLKPEYGGGFIALRNLDDPAKYASTEFAAEFVDELTKNDRQTFDDLRFRLRWPGISHNPFAAATNPGSKGHGWVKKLWVDGDFSGDDMSLVPEDFAFVQALPRDNPHLGESYWSLLDSLPERMRRALRDGLWDTFEGQAFPEFSRATHVVAPFTIPETWTRWTSTDYGYVDPWATLWLARSPDRQRVVVYREAYVKGLTATEQAKKLKAMTGTERMQLHVGDPSMWGQRERLSTSSVADEYVMEGVPLQPANNDRIGGWARLHENLAWEKLAARTNPPRLTIFNTCPNVIREIETIPLSETKPEDVDCFIAGTLVTTPNGAVPIETLRVGDYVDTPLGPRMVIKDGISGVARTMTVRLSDGRSLTGTPDHRVYVAGRGLVALSALCVSDILMPQSIAEGICRDDRAPTESHSSVMYAQHSLMVRYRPVSTSTISTATRGTMSAATLLYSAHPSTRCCTSPGVELIQSSETHCTHGIEAPMARANSAPTLRRCEPTRQSVNLRADIVERLLSRDTPTSRPARTNVPQRFESLRSQPASVRRAVRSSDLRTQEASRVHIVAVGHIEEPKQVYNLTVDEAHLYFANGVLVTNTDASDHALDALRYGLMVEGQRSRPSEEPSKGVRIEMR